jgi:hypothetical protein
MTTRNRELAGIIDDSGNITATGNLTVAGNLAQQSSTTTTYADNLLELNTGASSNSNDLGFVFERGSTGDNAILIWDESNDGFIVGTTSSTGTATGNITVTAGDFAAGKITVDNILINGTTIGHTSDTDLLTFASGVLTVAGEISVTTLDIGGTNVTSTAAELNILDGVNSTAAELNILDGVTATAAEINFLDGDTSATGTTLASADRVIVNDGGTMKQVALSDFETFFESEIDTFSTIDINGGSIDGATVGAASASTGAFTTLSASGALTGTLGTAAQGNVTSLGTLTALTVDNLGINGNTITANSGAVNITPAGGSAIVLDGTINVDAGVVTGATSITSTAFVGGLTGNVTGNTSGTALTVTQAAQTAITSVGTLTSLAITGDLDIADTGAGAITVGGTTNAYNAPVVINATDIGLAISDGTRSLALWGVHGGSSHNGSGIGTRSTHDMFIATNDTKRSIISGSGKTSWSAGGIGAVQTQPRDFTFYTEGGTNGVAIHSNDYRLVFMGGAASSGSGMDAGYLQLEVDGTAKIAFNTAGDSYFNGSGNVGIGTTSPVTALTVATAANISQVALTSSSNAVAWDTEAAANAYHVTTENTTFSAPSNANEGAIISVELAQGGTARTIAWNTVFEFAASTAPTVTATASKTDIFTFRYNGSVWQEIGRVQNMAQT